MENMEVTTSHNIVVSVQLAGLGLRVIATILDQVILLMFYVVVSMLGSMILIKMVVVPAAFFYHLIWEYFNDGQSPGKKIMNLRVVSLSGDRPELMSLVMRWMFRTVDVLFSLGVLGSVLMFSTRKKQRLGDILADTTVIKTRNLSMIDLSSILNINKADYEISYPTVNKYDDQDMLLVKEAIGRYQKKPSRDNLMVLQSLCQLIAAELKIPTPQPQAQISFLKKILSDYIVLTR